ncbi:hypothetical protein WDZ16_16215 [Pseudokineococcus marinus]|uniref:Uncharacterized protein n=1 Tax=Pseudokineococcus marinus TaxID=351215 RepID=A0A849BHQ4_9ACTN|nr:hypothetical protein [Pseudokineococcus marinus]NNH22091.1 hypothetical protein [Pseudokineococcus marinus]
MTTSGALDRVSYALLVVGAALSLVGVWGLRRPTGEGGADIASGSWPWRCRGSSPSGWWSARSGRVLRS